MEPHPPVMDWATDFDHTDEQWAADPYPIIEDLRQRCPIPRSERFGGVWMPVRHADVSAIANDTERFTSRSIIVSEHRPPMELAPEGIAPPISVRPAVPHGRPPDAAADLQPAEDRRPRAVAPAPTARS